MNRRINFDRPKEKSLDCSFSYPALPADGQKQFRFQTPQTRRRHHNNYNLIPNTAPGKASHNRDINQFHSPNTSPHSQFNSPNLWQKQEFSWRNNSSHSSNANNHPDIKYYKSLNEKTKNASNCINDYNSGSSDKVIYLKTFCIDRIGAVKGDILSNPPHIREGSKSVNVVPIPIKFDRDGIHPDLNSCFNCGDRHQIKDCSYKSNKTCISMNRTQRSDFSGSTKRTIFKERYFVEPEKASNHDKMKSPNDRKHEKQQSNSRSGKKNNFNRFNADKSNRSHNDKKIIEKPPMLKIYTNINEMPSSNRISREKEEINNQNRDFQANNSYRRGRNNNNKNGFQEQPPKNDYGYRSGISNSPFDIKETDKIYMRNDNHTPVMNKRKTRARQFSPNQSTEFGHHRTNDFSPDWRNQDLNRPYNNQRGFHPQHGTPYGQRSVTNSNRSAPPKKYRSYRTPNSRFTNNNSDKTRNDLSKSARSLRRE